MIISCEGVEGYLVIRTFVFHSKADDVFLLVDIVNCKQLGQYINFVLNNGPWLYKYKQMVSTSYSR